jgi:hypothetical protein
MDQIDQVKPTENAGSDTYRRFRAQAAMALPYVLGVILGAIDRVIMEHIDDFVVVRASALIELHQVKTRTDGRRWTLPALCSSNEHGRPMRRLLDRFRLVRHLRTLHVLHLQGEIDDAVRSLQAACEIGQVEAAEVDLAVRLGCERGEAHEFLLRTRVKNDVPHLDLIADVCMTRYIYPYLVKRLPAAEARDLHDRLLDRIGRAMEGEMTAPPDQFLGDILASRPPSDPVRRKTLGREDLVDFEDTFGSPRGELLGGTVPAGDWATALTEKFKAGGADTTLLEHVQTLRAGAYRRHIESLTGSGQAEAELEDAYRRIMSSVLETLGDLQERPAPAGRVFSSLARLIRESADSIDRRRVFDADPNLLLGAAFQLCDECRWTLT